MINAKQNLIYAVIGVFFFFEGYPDFCITFYHTVK